MFDVSLRIGGVSCVYLPITIIFVLAIISRSLNSSIDTLSVFENAWSSLKLLAIIEVSCARPILFTGKLLFLIPFDYLLNMPKLSVNRSLLLQISAGWLLSSFCDFIYFFFTGDRTSESFSRCLFSKTAKIFWPWILPLPL